MILALDSLMPFARVLSLSGPKNKCCLPLQDACSNHEMSIWFFIIPAYESLRNTPSIIATNTAAHAAINAAIIIGSIQNYLS